jgi:hypothetical protein
VVPVLFKEAARIQVKLQQLLDELFTGWLRNTAFGAQALDQTLRQHMRRG